MPGERRELWFGPPTMISIEMSALCFFSNFAVFTVSVWFTETFFGVFGLFPNVGFDEPHLPEERRIQWL
eukprot:s3836_g4.t1